VHPFFEPGGERAPVTDPHASASIFGLGAGGADLLQATREGLAFNARMSHDALGVDAAPVALGGGLARDARFASLLATILRRPVLQRPTPHAGLLGLGLLAVQHLGLAPLQSTASAWLAAEGSIAHPDEGATGRFYERKYTLHRNLVEAVRPFWAELASLHDEARRLNAAAEACMERRHESALS
jgi:erythritol kinase (D-erythritol 1-phosphate-forming)